ncbi:MAG: aspartate aminotransferase family protein [Actinomycetota bacterium]|nr:aspartate aminotransferase family protein [Actinomycetota bacterium]
MSSEPARSEPNDGRLDALIEEQEAIFLERQPESARLLERARESLAGGVTSSWQIARPQAVWISHGAGSKVYDADGNEYVDLHGGYGVMAVGHSHPRIVQAVSRRISRGSHFAQPTQDSIAVAEELARRFGLPLWRFSNSGTEATMDAVHLMRAATKRDKIVKVEGTYHGHHDSVMVSVANDASEIGDDPDYPLSAPSGTGIPSAVTDLVVVIEYNDIESLRRAFARHPGEIAGVIMEPIMMNSGIIPPRDGYLEQVKSVVHEDGALLAFDEVKTGLTVSPGGATAYLGVSPDIICLAKALGGGLPCGALGGTTEVMNLIVEGEYEQVGTFNGNPLTMAASLATLTEVLTDDAYETVSSLRTQMVQGCEEAIREFDLAAHVVAIGAKGCITFAPAPVHNYREFLQIDDRYSHCHWLFQHNGGVFLPPWGKAEQWLLSPQHSADDARRFIDNFRTFAGALRG